MSFLLLITCCPALLEEKINPDCRLLTNNHEALVPDYTIQSEVEKRNEVYRMANIGPIRWRHDLRYQNFDDSMSSVSQLSDQSYFDVSMSSVSFDSDSNVDDPLSSHSATIDGDISSIEEDSFSENQHLNRSSNTIYSFSSDSCPPELNISSNTFYSFSSDSTINSNLNSSVDSYNDSPCHNNSNKSIFLNNSVDSNSSVHEILTQPNLSNETIDLDNSLNESSTDNLMICHDEKSINPKKIIVIDDSSDSNESGDEMNVILPKTPTQLKRIRIVASPRVLHALKHRLVFKLNSVLFYDLRVFMLGMRYNYGKGNKILVMKDIFVFLCYHYCK